VSFARFQLIPTAGADRASLNRLVASEKLLGYFVIPDDPVANDAGAEYVSSRLTNLSLEQWYSRQVTAVVRAQRIREQGIDDETAGWIGSPVAFKSIRLTKNGNREDVELSDWITQWAPVGFVYFLWVSIFAVTQMLLTNTVEEKSNRLVEVLLSSISAVDLMAGKILGIAITGLTIVGTWLAVFLLTAVLLPDALDAPAALDFSGLARNPTYLISFLVYFLLGYFFYAAVLCGLGSFANNLKEAQNLMIPVQLCLFVPLMVMIPIGRDPNGMLAEVMTWIPPFTPFVMMNRAAFPPGAWTYVLTTVVMLVSIYVALRIAARVFETGMLMTGQPPRVRQMMAMLRRGSHP
jgi:ABC-2 type transport system permease protein